MAAFQVKCSYMFLTCRKRYGSDGIGALKYLRSPDITTYPILLPVQDTEQTSNDKALHVREMAVLTVLDPLIRSSNIPPLASRRMEFPPL
jgi:hypothetical protein